MPETTPRPARPVLLRGVRRVSTTGRRDPAPLDVRLADGRVAEVGPGLSAGGAEVVDAAGGWLLPGLWDAHVHLGQWGSTFSRLPTTATASPEAVLELVAARVAELDSDPARRREVVLGFGHRTGSWWRACRVDELDRVAAEHPVVLVSGDVHSCWMSSSALALLGLAPRTGSVEEREWFDAQPRLLELPGAAAQNELGLARAVRAAAARGVVGVTDLEFAPNHRLWPQRLAAGAGGPGSLFSGGRGGLATDPGGSPTPGTSGAEGDSLAPLRIRAGVYAEDLPDVLARGLRTGDPLDPAVDPAGLLTMGPLKIIVDGSLNTRTAWCCDPYADTSAALSGLPGHQSRGAANYAAEELVELLTRARDHGLRVALHAIGDATAALVADLFERTGAQGSVEHLQLARPSDVRRLAAQGVRASVQPAHLWDDRDVTELNWPGRTQDCFGFRTMLDAGLALVLGSDAPVSPLDPWLAMAAAVHRSADERPPWHPEQALTLTEALTASTDGVRAVEPGGPADVVLLAEDPTRAGETTAETASRLRATEVWGTWVAGLRSA